MHKVTGIGGVFFRSDDPERLANWYRDMLGVDPAPQGPDTPPWQTEGGITVFAPFGRETDYYPPGQQVMINFRVADMEGMLAQLRAAGVEHFNEQTMEGLGRFAHITDPEGNAIELWEPAPVP